MRKLAPLFATMLLLAAAQLAIAQNPQPTSPLSIEKGHIALNGHIDHPGTFTFQGAGVILSGGLVDGGVAPDCTPCAAGDQLNVATGFTGESSIRAGTATIGEVSRDVFYSGYLMLSGEPITIPTRYTRLPFKITFPVTLHGRLQVHKLNPFINGIEGLLYDLPLNLRGTATLTLKLVYLLPVSGHPIYSSQGLSFELSASDATQDN